MTLAQFDHVCRAAAAVADVGKIYVFGANAIIPWLAPAGHSIPLPILEPSRDVDGTTGKAELDLFIRWRHR